MRDGEVAAIPPSELASGWEYSEPSREEEPITVIPMPDIMGITMGAIRDEPIIPHPNTILLPPTMLPNRPASTIGAITGTKVIMDYMQLILWLFAMGFFVTGIYFLILAIHA